MNETKEFLNHLRHEAIVAEIRAAEKKTSGEIRVFITHKHTLDPAAAAKKAFEKIGMTNTRLRNGVLIFVAPRSHKFAVIGDKGVHERCGDDFWKILAAEMEGHFKKSDFSTGIIHGIHKTGELLALHFPPQPGDVNELPDEIEID